MPLNLTVFQTVVVVDIMGLGRVLLLRVVGRVLLLWVVGRVML